MVVIFESPSFRLRKEGGRAKQWPGELKTGKFKNYVTPLFACEERVAERSNGRVS
jgi:poly-gamma-glutamate capsule biosynthesis protein CapA/YwtB (metallophosphatase superfamily)